jgi:hypothetical protein
VTKAANDLLNAVRDTLGLKEADALWYSSGQVMIWAEAKTHESAARLFADLADPAAKLDGSAAVGGVAMAMLGPVEAIDRKGLADVLRQGLGGEDLAVLAAPAFCSAGGDTWDNFRAESRHVVANQDLPGSVVVLVNRLAAPRLPFVAATN